MNGSKKFLIIIYFNQLRHFFLKLLLQGMVPFKIRAVGRRWTNNETIKEIITNWEWHCVPCWYQFQIIQAQWVILFVCHFCHHLFLLPKTCIYLSLKRQKTNGPDFMLNLLYYRIGFYFQALDFKVWTDSLLLRIENSLLKLQLLKTLGPMYINDALDWTGTSLLHRLYLPSVNHDEIGLILRGSFN